MRARTASPEATEELGARIARARPESDTALAVLYLEGSLGSGKTTFARGFARALRIAGLIRSPTYTLLEVYPTPEVTLVHLDLYRLRSPAEIETLGLRDLTLPRYLWLIEWPEKGTGHLPPPDLTVRFTALDAAHEIELTAASALGRAWQVQLTGVEQTP
jgi:tRNA threonylcarbamoyladenosine biosynthesis protein TsaE